MPIAPAVGGLLFPQNQALGVDHFGFSPRVQQKIVHADVNSVSYQQASYDLAELADLMVGAKPVERMAKGSAKSEPTSVTPPSRRSRSGR